jgi:hypothetical protein
MLALQPGQVCNQCSIWLLPHVWLAAELAVMRVSAVGVLA